MSNIYINSGGSSIPELTSDPVSPTPQSAWVLKSGGAGGAGVGEAYGLLLSLTQPGAGSATYQFSYYTLEGTTIRVTMS